MYSVSKLAVLHASILRTPSRSIELPLRAIQFLRLPVFVLGFSLFYFLAAKIGIATQLPPKGIVVIWPPNAIVLVTLLAVPREKWWIFFLATVATEITADVPHYPLWAAAGYGIVNFIEAASVAILLSLFRISSARLVTLRDFLVFVAIGPFLASGIAALIGAAIYKLGTPDLDYLYYWRVFWFGDALGLLTIGTTLLAWRKPVSRWKHLNWYAIAHAIVFGLGFAGMASWLFFANAATQHLYLIFPFLIWIAVRFQVQGACAAVLATIALAIWSAVAGAGPFAPYSNIEAVLSLQGLVLVTAVSTFALAFAVEDSHRSTSELLHEVYQRKSAEEELRKSNRALEQINETLDQTVADRTSALTNSLARNKLLLAELKHRIKNNLQIVSGLIGLHSRSLSDERGREKLVKVQGQIGAIAATYDLLHQTDSTEVVDFGKIVPALCQNIASSLGELVSIAVEVVGSSRVPADTAIALSLILNELVTNSAKHAAHPVKVGISCETCGEEILLGITDDGQGFPPDFDIEQTRGFGFRMVRSLLTQVNGTWRFVTNERGTTIEIRVPVSPR